MDKIKANISQLTLSELYKLGRNELAIQYLPFLYVERKGTVELKTEANECYE